MANISELYNEVEKYGNYPPEYWDKMMHPIPNTTVVDRERYILERVKDKTVLDIGCSGPLSERIALVTREFHGIDKTNIIPNLRGIHIQKAPLFGNDGDRNKVSYYPLDLDQINELPKIPGLDLIIAAEIIEHLSNAGHFLDLLHPVGAPVILTTPNAHTRVGRQYLKKGIESVNKEHVAWYSWHTMKTLLTRHNFNIKQWHWYRGDPYYAEGLIFVIEADHGKD